MRYRHTMVRIRNVEDSLDFWCNKMGMIETRRNDNPQGRFTLIFLAAPGDVERARAEKVDELELTFNYDVEDYGTARNFGHLAYEVDDIFAFCEALEAKGVTINRPPRDGRIAFVRSPDLISVELIQKDGPKMPVPEKWSKAPNIGVW